MRFRNFSRFDLFSSFHIRVNCWSLSSAIVVTASTLDENAGTTGKRPTRFTTGIEGRRCEGPLVDKPFLRNPRAATWTTSVRKCHNQVVADRFGSIHSQGELRRRTPRLPALKVPRAAAVLARNHELVSVHEPIRQH